MRSFAVSLTLAIVSCGFNQSIANAADLIQVTVRTHIDEPDPQAGMKSEQTITVNFKKGVYTTSFKTGVTKIVGATLESVRDKFQVENFKVVGGIASFEVRGQTASGVMFMPNIDYKFKLTVDDKGKGTLTGCHDGYPSYDVVIEGKTVHNFKHGRMELIKLFGTCDIAVPNRNF